ncbi:hypothetical protein JCM15519_07120 [Fundidesulfovibrio butyratiphilus]
MECQSYEEIIAHVKAHTPGGHVLLSFSGGKDAWVTWLACRDHFELTPFYYYLVPGLEFVEDYLAYAERRLGKHIIRLPNPRLFDMLREGVFQPPERWPVINAAQLPKMTYDDLSRAAEDAADLPERCWTALGVRAADSARRALVFKTHGAINETRRYFYPVWDWRKDRLVEALQKECIKLPIDYELFGRTFDGIYLLYLWNIKNHFPRDYQRILEWFPDADMEVWRYERSLKKAG